MIRFYGNPWASSRIRGEQVVEKLVERGVDAVYNSDDYASKGDKLVFVKCSPHVDSYEIVKACESFIDAVDSHGTIIGIKKYEHLKNVSIIAIGDLSQTWISEQLPDHTVIKIPEHHCNFENVIRPKDKKIKKVGFCGYMYNFHLPLDQIQNMLHAADLEVVVLSDMVHATRKDICNFYEQIDIQICYRRDIGVCVPQLKNPLKVINAASFGVPTVSYLEPAYKECQDILTVSYDIYDMVSGIVQLTDIDYYNEMSEKCIEFAKDYHIDKIVSKYVEILC